MELFILQGAWGGGDYGSQQSNMMVSRYENMGVMFVFWMVLFLNCGLSTLCTSLVNVNIVNGTYLFSFSSIIFNLDKI